MVDLKKIKPHLPQSPLKKKASPTLTPYVSPPISGFQKLPNVQLPPFNFYRKTLAPNSRIKGVYWCIKACGGEGWESFGNLPGRQMNSLRERFAWKDWG